MSLKTYFAPIQNAWLSFWGARNLREQAVLRWGALLAVLLFWGVGVLWSAWSQAQQLRADLPALQAKASRVAAMVSVIPAKPKPADVAAIEQLLVQHGATGKVRSEVGSVWSITEMKVSGAVLWSLIAAARTEFGLSASSVTLEQEKGAAGLWTGTIVLQP